MPNVVSNTTPIIYLTKLDELRLLREVYGHVYVCSPVAEDIARLYQRGHLKKGEMEAVSKAESQQWLIRKDPADKVSLALLEEFLDLALGQGEATSMALAKEMKAVFLANDRRAIQVAQEYGIETRWYTEILQDALKVGYVKSLNEYVELLDRSVESGLYLSKTQRNKALEHAAKIADNGTSH